MYGLEVKRGRMLGGAADALVCNGNEKIRQALTTTSAQFSEPATYGAPADIVSIHAENIANEVQIENRSSRSALH